MLDRGKPVVRWGLGHALPRTLMRMAARRGDLQGRLASVDSQLSTDQLVPLFDQIRATGSVVPGRLADLTVDHAAVKQILTSNDFATGSPDLDGHRTLAGLLRWSAHTGLHPLQPPSLLVTEPPRHTRYRRLVSKVFSARAVERLRGRTEQIAAELLDRIEPGSPVDLVPAYCEQLPVTVIAEILGVPEADRAQVLRLGADAAASLDLGVSWRRFTRVEHSLNEFDAWLTEHLDHLRRTPGEDLLSELVHATDDGQRLTQEELKSTAGLVLVAGFETTVNLLSNGIRLLVDHPEQLAGLRQDPQGWPNAVEEVLRIDPPVMLTSRAAIRDTPVAGHTVAAGRMVVTVLSGANRDPQVFTDPDRFDVTRANAREHLSFSAGRHFCLGAALARMEGEVGLRSLFDRYDVQLCDGARRRDTRILRGYASLPAQVNCR